MNWRSSGFTLLELMVALALGAVVLAGILAATQSLVQSIRQQQALVDLQSTARLALTAVAAEVEAAAARPTPWLIAPIPAVIGSVNAMNIHSGRLVVRTHSSRNCLGNDNPIREADGYPAFWLLHSEFEVRAPGRLVRTCYYGPGPGLGTRQLSSATLAEGVEALRLRFGEDLTGDRQVDRWVTAGDWGDEASVLGVRLGLLIASETSVNARPLGPIVLLGDTIPTAADGRPRLALVQTVPIRSRLR